MLHVTKMFPRVNTPSINLILFKKFNRSILSISLGILALLWFQKAFSTETYSPPKIFLYQSKLPKPLLRYKKKLRSHVIDVLLSTQKYEVVFSEIPKFIAKGNVPQFIIKYKIRTNPDIKSLYNIELTLINADSIKMVKTVSYVSIPKSKLLYQFRLHLYEFILGKKLSNKEESKFNQISRKKINKIENSPELKSLDENNEKRVTNNKTQQETNMDKSSPENIKNAPSANLKRSPPPANKRTSLWDLLKDNDIDPTWLEQKISNKESSSNNESNKNDSKEKSSKAEKNNLQGPANPFLKTRIVTKEEEEQDLRIDMFHLAWRVVDRNQEVTDLISLTNSFFSIIGLTFEWVIHNPLNLNNLYFRGGFEVDKSLKTTPIKLSDHSLFRMGVGFKMPLNILPSIYFETNSLVFANLNSAGEGFQDNIVSVYWSTIELALLTNKLYIGFQYSKSIDSSTLLEGINFTNLEGDRVGANLRYFSDISIFSLNLWTDLEYRVESFNATNIDSVNRKLNIVKKELAVKLGFYF